MLKCILHMISLLLALTLCKTESGPGGLELSIPVGGLEPTVLLLQPP